VTSVAALSALFTHPLTAPLYKTAARLYLALATTLTPDVSVFEVVAFVYAPEGVPVTLPPSNLGIAAYGTIVIAISFSTYLPSVSRVIVLPLLLVMVKLLLIFVFESVT
jgi:hypothetical protein